MLLKVEFPNIKLTFYLSLGNDAYLSLGNDAFVACCSKISV